MRTQKTFAHLLLIGSLIAFPVHADAIDDDQTISDEEALVTNDSNDSQFGISAASNFVRPAVKAGFDAFNTKYQHQWKANYANGKVKLLYGPASKVYGNTPERASKAFLSDAHAVFGLKADLSDLQVKKVDKTTTKNHVRFQQTVGGVPVVGAQMIVHSNPDGRVTMTQNNYVVNPKISNQEVVTADAAKLIARNDLLATASNQIALADSKAEKQLIQQQQKYRYVWKVTTPSQHPFGHWVYRIDAESGDILYKANEIDALKSGKGKVYKDNAAWQVGTISSVSLKNMYTTADGFQQGYLWGSHANIYDDNGNDPFSSTLSFIYDPFADKTAKDAFDATAAYYQLNTIWDWWNQNILKKYSLSTPDYFNTYSIPAVVNIIGLCNAFYTPDIDGDGNPGFAFGDDDACATGSVDFTNDSDVFHHEFGHAMMDWSGFDIQFGGNTDGYGRAMGEGNADWYAFLATPKDPRIGEVALVWPGADYTRDLDNTHMYPRDVDVPYDVSDPTSGVPEEHYTGEIWGGYLYDLYRVLKKSAIPYVYQSSYYFSATNGNMAGEADFFDAIDAQAIAELDLKGKQTSTAKAWGSMVSRGITAARRAPYSHSSDYFGSSAAGSDDPAYFYFSFPTVKSVKTSGNLLLTGDVHEYVIQTTVSGLDLTVSVTPGKNGLLNPTIALYNIGGTLLNTTSALANKKTTLTYAALPIDTYVITVTGDATTDARGYYTFSVGAK